MILLSVVDDSEISDEIGNGIVLCITHSDRYAVDVDGGLGRIVYVGGIGDDRRLCGIPTTAIQQTEFRGVIGKFLCGRLLYGNRFID